MLDYNLIPIILIALFVGMLIGVAATIVLMAAATMAGRQEDE